VVILLQCTLQDSSETKKRHGKVTRSLSRSYRFFISANILQRCPISLCGKQKSAAANNATTLWSNFMGSLHFVINSY